MRIRKSALGGLTAALAMVVMATGCGTTNATNSAANNTSNTSSSGSTGTSTSAPQNATGANFSSLKTTTQQWSSPPKMTIDPKKQYDAVVHTNMGDFTIKLDAKDSPKTVNNFVFLAKHNFYNNDAFFRIIQSFMIQTGDPKNNGTGGPGYQFADELPPKQKYAPGVVAMANAGPNTNGSQFFIGTGQDVNSLNQQPNYTIFGNVVSGMSVVQKIAAIPVVQNPQTGEPSYPTKVAYIKSVDIQVK